MKKRWRIERKLYLCVSYIRFYVDVNAGISIGNKICRKQRTTDSGKYLYDSIINIKKNL